MLKCAVCEVPSSGHHFGVTCCRACAAFFRRTLSLTLRYKCRFDGKCEVTQRKRYSCRHCRFKKCLVSGMKKEIVQITTGIESCSDVEHQCHSSSVISQVPVPSIVPRYQFTTIIRNESYNESSVLEMCGGNTLQYQISNMQMILKGKLDTYFDKTTTSSSFPYSIPLTISQQGMIAYADHTRKWSDCTPGRTREVSIIDLDVFMKNIYLEIEYLAQFCMSIQPFAQLPKDQKWLLFKHFWPGFFELYRCYQSCIILGYNIDDDRCVCLDGAIINFKCHMTKLDIVTELSEEQVRAFMKPSHDYFKELVINPFKKMKPREFELIYMSMNFMWNIKHIPGVNDSTLAIANQVKNRLDEEFHNYYTHELLMPNYASRLHRMSDIVSALDKLHERRREDSQVSRTFNIFKQDVFLSELI